MCNKDKRVNTVHAEIEYLTRAEMCNKVHSDICPPGCSSANMDDESWRKFLHECLDEWLDTSDGTGGFYIKQEGYKFDFQ